MSVECFWVEPLPLISRRLRRYHSSATMNDASCPQMEGSYSYHDADIVIGDVDKPIPGAGEYEHAPCREDLPQDAPWPTHCGCGYAFLEQDVWQVNDDRYFARSMGIGIAPTPDAERWVAIRSLPPGAMFHAWWLEPKYVGPDGMSLGVIYPSGDAGEVFPMDFPATDGGRWSRTGTPPKITLSPSIHLVGRWHGFLHDGVLVDA